ncbi:hypothetical protein GCM10022389_20860 [Flavobacterium cheonanense]|uniref:BACON domain-containing protein n=1 Tax=Flavobacterium cheonanense TaxID=706183 RepID=A0ABP7VW06_9FLAO
MKQIIIIIIIFAFILPFSAYSQVGIWEEANQCFKLSDYVCAEAKYKELIKSTIGEEKQIAITKAQRAKKCIENLKNANLAFNSKNYTKAKELYLAILDSNPNDDNAKSQLDNISNLLKKATENSLGLSKTQIYQRSSGGNEYINVTTNSKTYTIDLLPSWCTVQKYDSYFVINCSINYQSTARSDYFNVKAGDKTIRVNISQEGGVTQKTETNLSLSKANLYFLKNGGDENIIVTTNNNNFSIELIPSWCTFQKFSNSIIVTCLQNNTNQSRSDWFKITAGNKEVKVYVNQEASVTNSYTESVKTPRKKLGSFSSIGFQSGEIAKYGFIYERGGIKTVGFRISARTSLTSEQDILNGTATKNKTEIELGPNFRILNRLYLNIGFGYGYYERLLNNDFAGDVFLEKTGYSVATTGLMFRISRAININGGASFMDIEKDFYKPEFTFGVTYNLKNKNDSEINSSQTQQKRKSVSSRNYKSNLSSFSSLGFYSGKNAKYGLFYETGGSRVTGFHISARTSLKEETVINGQLILNRSELELGPNFKMSNRLYLNLGVGYGIYDYGLSNDIYMGTDDYFTANAGIMFRVSKVININAGYSFENFDIEYNKPEMTFGISFNIWD